MPRWTHRTLAAILATSLCCVAIAPLVSAAQHPARSERAARFQQWRLQLREAGLAAERGDREVAIQHLESILSEAAQHDERGLLVARAHDGLADQLREAGRCVDALPHYRAAASMWIELLKGPQPRQAVTLHHLGLCQIELKAWDAATESLRQATAVWLAADGEESEGLAQTKRALEAARKRQPIPWARDHSQPKE